MVAAGRVAVPREGQRSTMTRLPRRRRQHVADVVTPTPAEAIRADLRGRRRRYALVMGSCVVLMLFGFFVPAPVPVRLVALAVAAVLAPLAAIAGNGGPSG